MSQSWCPLFSTIVDSSIWEEDDVTVKIFLTLLAKKGSDHIVRGTAFNIGRWARKTEAEAIRALKILSEPDTKRLEPQPYDGRRIERVEGGWLVLNGKFYEEEMRKVSRRIYKAKKERERRERLNGKPMMKSSGSLEERNTVANES